MMTDTEDMTLTLMLMLMLFQTFRGEAVLLRWQRRTPGSGGTRGVLIVPPESC